MSNRPCGVRSSVSREPSRNRMRRSDFNRRGNQRISSCNNIRTIQEECENLPMVEEEYEFENQEQDTRYDPKELRDVVKILSPFVKLINDTKNPYARIVTREICKTFYHLFQPDVHPEDIIKSFNLSSKTQRSAQLWNEFWLYVPGGVIKDWIPLINTQKEENLVDLNDCNSRQPQNSRLQQEDCPPSTNLDINELFNHKNDSPESTNPYCTCEWDSSHENPPNNFSSTGKSPESLKFTEDAKDICITMDCNTCGNIDPSTIMCDHQSAGSDSQAFVFSNFLSNNDENKDTSELDATQISGQILDNNYQKLPEYTNRKCFFIPENMSKENELLNNANYQISPKRQTAGNDRDQYCEPGSSSGPIQYSDNPNQYDYNRITGNTSTSSRPNQDLITEPEVRINVIDNNETNNRECSDSDSVQSVQDLNINHIACNASMVANAFTNLTLATNELKKKKEAFKKLTNSYMNVAPNSSESSARCDNNVSAIMIPQKISSFDDHEWNDSAFKDRDFIRILPFYESIHNELEYISKEQRGYGYNMLDDIMSTLYHIHYDLGDPRLKNELLVDHVKLITANTWETYFYKGNRKMPAIPNPNAVCSMQQFPRQSNLTNQRQPCPRISSPRELSPSHPSSREPCPQPPVHRRPSVPCNEPVANEMATANNRPQSRTTSCRRIADEPQQNENLPETKPRNFLRRSRPSGAPKGWAPKLKPTERPDNIKEFKARPLPKFVRDRLSSRNNDRQC